MTRGRRTTRNRVSPDRRSLSRGLLHDVWTLNRQVSEINRRELLVGR